MINNLIFVDCEANSPCPNHSVGTGLTEFAAIHFVTKKIFYGNHLRKLENYERAILYRRFLNITISGVGYLKIFQDFDKWLKDVCEDKKPKFISDNPAFDWQFINWGFLSTLGYNPFGHSARRISDFYAGLTEDFYNTQKWKKWRITKHTHNPIDDCLGNVEAFERIIKEFDLSI